MMNQKTKRFFLEIVVFIIGLSSCSQSNLNFYSDYKNLFLVYENHVEKIINEEGEVVWVSKEGDYVLLDRKENIFLSREGVGSLYDNKGSLIFKINDVSSGNLVGDYLYAIQSRVDDKRSLIDLRTGKILIGDFKNFRDAYLHYIPLQIDGKWGVYDTSKGMWKINPKYDGMSTITKGQVVVRIGDLKKTIDLDGNEIDDSRFESRVSSEYSDFFAGKEKNDQFAFYSADGRRMNWGNPCVDPAVLQGRFFSDGVAIVVDGSKFYYITESGNRLNAEAYEVVTPFSEGLAFVKHFRNDKSFICINNKGEKVFTLSDTVGNTDPFHNGLARIGDGDDDSWYSGFVDRSGRIVWWSK